MNRIALLSLIGFVMVAASRVATGADEFKPEPGYISLFNGQNLTGWCYNATNFFDGKTEAEISALQTKISDRGYLEIEREAKFMASCILMRASVIMERFHHFYSAQSERSNNESVILNFVIRQLGRDFCVSRPAISLRCSSLELIDKAELDNMLLN